PANQPDVLIVYTGQIGLIRFFEGRLPEFEPIIDAAAASTPEIPALRAALAVMLVELGRVEEAREIFDDIATDQFACFPKDLLWLSGISLCAQVCYRLHDREQAIVLLDLLAPYAGLCIAEGPNFLGS